LKNFIDKPLLTGGASKYIREKYCKTYLIMLTNINIEEQAFLSEVKRHFPRGVRGKLRRAFIKRFNREPQAMDLITSLVKLREHGIEEPRTMRSRQLAELL
jgi:hypothetical protein